MVVNNYNDIIMPMKSLFSFLRGSLIIGSLFMSISFFALPAMAATDPQAGIPNPKTSTTTTKPAATTCNKPNGVLLPNDCVDDLSFNQYLRKLLIQLIPLILFFAMIMIVYSGIQYMFSGFKPDQAGKAKQRIVGILIGVLFFLIISILIKQLSPELLIS